MLGISPYMMFYIKDQIKNVTGVTQVLKTNQTVSEGCWNIITDVNNFQRVCQASQMLLHQWINLITADAYPNKLNLPPAQIPQPGSSNVSSSKNLS